MRLSTLRLILMSRSRRRPKSLNIVVPPDTISRYIVKVTAKAAVLRQKSKSGRAVASKLWSGYRYR
jgi:hypothetical protein